MLEHDNGRQIVYLVHLSHCREAFLIDFARPEVTQDRQDMGVPNEGLKGPLQLSV
jgi:hypothetical protein